jgi:hypothetical protein
MGNLIKDIIAMIIVKIITGSKKEVKVDQDDKNIS